MWTRYSFKNIRKIKSKKVITPSKQPSNSNGYEYDFGECVTTCYGKWDGCSDVGCSGVKLKENYHCASHNLPCGTKIYIPDFKGVINKDGIFEVQDTGGMCFDFDLYVSKDKASKVGWSTHKVYVVSWGKGKMCCSYTHICKYLVNANRFKNYLSAWEKYKKVGKLIKFYKFNSEDKDITKQSWY